MAGGFAQRHKAVATGSNTTNALLAEMTDARKAAVAAKEAAVAAKQAAFEAQKAAREEHERTRAIVPNKPTKAPIKRAVPLRRPKVVVRVRPLAESGGHSNVGAPVSKCLTSWADGKIVLEDVGVDHGNGTGIRSQEYSFADTVLGPDAKQIEVHKAATDGLVKAVCDEGFNGLLFAYGQTGTGKTHTIFGPESSWTSLRHEVS
jgi:hypothetical protein